MKNNFYLKQCNYALSLPSRERGLKFRTHDTGCPHGMSLPSRERGLKLPFLALIERLRRRSLHGSVD